jgi:hypothetical protein
MEAFCSDFRHDCCRAKLRISPYEYAIGWCARATTKLLQAGKQLIYPMNDLSISTIEILIEYLSDSSTNESKGELITSATSLVSEVSFGRQLKLLAPDDQGALIDIYRQDALSVGKHQPSRPRRGPAIATQQIEMKLSPLGQVLRLEGPQ